MSLEIYKTLLISALSNTFEDEVSKYSIDSLIKHQFEAVSEPINDCKNLEISELFEDSQTELARAHKPCISIQVWMTTESTKKVENSMKKLNITHKKLAQKDKLDKYLNEQSLDILVSIKEGVKRQLKKYDNSFLHIFKRLPTQEQKQPTGPLQYYYKKIKQSIFRKESNQTNEKIMNLKRKEKELLKQNMKKYQVMFKMQYHRLPTSENDFLPIMSQYLMYHSLKKQLLLLEEKKKKELKHSI